MAAVDLPPPRAGNAAGLPVVVDAGRGCALWICDAGLACCAVEVAAALSRVGPGEASAGPPGGALAGPSGGALAGPSDGALAGASAGVNVFVVAGTVTDKLAPLVLRA